MFRCEDAADMNDLKQSDVETIANDIEEKLHNLNQDINPKYKNKYRSLVFNLKDVKNQVSSCSGREGWGVESRVRGGVVKMVWFSCSVVMGCSLIRDCFGR